MAFAGSLCLALLLLPSGLADNATQPQRQLRGLSGTIYCNPQLHQMCPPGDVACPQCGSDRCECPSGPGPSPSPSPSPSGARCGRSAQVCTSSEACVGFYHSWGCVGGCARNIACQAPQGTWDGCSPCGDRAEYLMDWNNPGGGLSFQDALSKVAGEFPNDCGCLASGPAPGPAPAPAPGGSGIFCDPSLHQMCPPGDVACPQCGSNRCECPAEEVTMLQTRANGGSQATQHEREINSTAGASLASGPTCAGAGAELDINAICQDFCQHGCGDARDYRGGCTADPCSDPGDHTSATCWTCKCAFGGPLVDMGSAFFDCVGQLHPGCTATVSHTTGRSDCFSWVLQQA